jgi:hypothetical protein
VAGLIAPFREFLREQEAEIASGLELVEEIAHARVNHI